MTSGCRWLLLCDAGDESAPWIAEALRARHFDGLAVVTARDLGRPGRLRFTNQGPSGSLHIEIGEVLVNGAALGGVVNRLVEPPTPDLRVVRSDDRDYFREELFALHLSWLASLRCPMINRPSPRGLSGAIRDRLEWAHLAVAAGLAVRPFALRSTMPETLAPPAGPIPRRTRRVFVVGGRVVSPGEVPLPAEVVAASLRLAAMTDLPLLAFDLDLDAGCHFHIADPLPYLPEGGDDLADAVAEFLREGGP